MVTYEEGKKIWENIKKEYEEKEQTKYRYELDDKERLERLYINQRKTLQYLCRRYRLRRDEMISILENHNIPLKNVNSARRKQGPSGYVMLYFGNGIMIPEHRYIWEQMNGPIPKGWIVHHLNGIKNDNRIENLVTMSRHKHPKIIYTEHAHNGVTVITDFTKLLQEKIRTLEKRNSELLDLVKGYEDIINDFT